MMKKTSLSVIGTFILALSAIPAAQAYDIKDNSGYYSFTGPSHRSVILTYFSLENNLDAYSGDVDIPASISYMTNDIPVKGVGDHALFNCQGVTSVKLPEGLTYILDQAFSHCYAMRSLTLPSTLELIKDYAFEYCDDLTSVTIPAKVSEFGYAVFSNCLGLKEIKVEEGNTILEDQDGILYMKGGELLVQYPAGRPDQVFVIPQSVSVITDYAFSPAPYLVSVEIGDKVTDIAPLTFLECGNLEQITVSTSNPYLTSEEGVLYDKNKTRILQFPRANRTEDLILPSTLTVIEDLAFSQAQNLRHVTLPSSLSSIGTYAFLGSLPESITSLATTPPSTHSPSAGQDPWRPHGAGYRRRRNRCTPCRPYRQ